MKIVPAILTDNFNKINSFVDLIKHQFNYVQVDVVDGVFANNKTFPYKDNEDVNLLDNLEVNFELDLMIQDVENDLEKYLNTNAKKIIIHYNSTKKIDEIIKRVREHNKEIFIAVNSSNLEDIVKIPNNIDGIQCMGIDKVGFQSQPFNEEVFNLIDKVKNTLPSKKISFDGGTNRLNIDKLISKNLDSIAVGSLLFSGDIKENINFLIKRI